MLDCDVPSSAADPRFGWAYACSRWFLTGRQYPVPSPSSNAVNITLRARVLSELQGPGVWAQLTKMRGKVPTWGHSCCCAAQGVVAGRWPALLAEGVRDARSTQRTASEPALGARAAPGREPVPPARPAVRSGSDDAINAPAVVRPRLGEL